MGPPSGLTKVSPAPKFIGFALKYARGAKPLRARERAPSGSRAAAVMPRRLNEKLVVSDWRVLTQAVCVVSGMDPGLNRHNGETAE